MDYFSLLDKLIISSSTVLFGSILDQNKVEREVCARLYRLHDALYPVKLILFGGKKNSQKNEALANACMNRPVVLY
jgi:hypothetical protein